MTHIASNKQMEKTSVSETDLQEKLKKHNTFN